jgi:hypothetical protein
LSFVGSLVLFDDIFHIVIRKHGLLLVQDLGLAAGGRLHMVQVEELGVSRIDVLFKAEDLVFIQRIYARVKELMLHHGHGLEVLVFELPLQVSEVDVILLGFRFFQNLVFFFHKYLCFV